MSFFIFLSEKGQSFPVHEILYLSHATDFKEITGEISDWTGTESFSCLENFISVF